MVKTVTRLGVPSIAENLLVSGILLSDVLMLARLENNTVYLAATALTGVAYWRLANIAGCTQIGAGAYVARRWGEGRFADAGRAVAHALALSTAIGVVAAIAVWGVMRALFLLLSGDETVADTAFGYFRFLMVALPVRLALLNVTSCMRAAGDTRTPLVLVLLMLGMNVGLNWLLIFGNLGMPRMLMNGAGLSTALSYGAALAVALFVLFRGVRPRRLISANAGTPVSVGPPSDGEEYDMRLVPSRSGGEDGVLKLDPAGFRLWFPKMTPSILRVSNNSLWEEVLVGVGFLTYLGMLGRFGTEVMAAHGAAVRIESLSYTTGWGISIATATMVGQALGARNVALAKRMFSLNIVLAMTAMGMLGILYCAAPEWLLGWFDLGEKAMVYGSLMMLVLGVQQCFIGSAMVMTGGLRGAGDTFPTVITQLFGVIGMRLGVGWFLAFHLEMGYAGVYWATLLDWMMRTALLGVFVWRGRWKDATV